MYQVLMPQDEGHSWVQLLDFTPHILVMRCNYCYLNGLCIVFHSMIFAYINHAPVLKREMKLLLIANFTSKNRNKMELVVLNRCMGVENCCLN